MRASRRDERVPELPAEPEGDRAEAVRAGELPDADLEAAAAGAQGKGRVGRGGRGSRGGNGQGGRLNFPPPVI